MAKTVVYKPDGWRCQKDPELEKNPDIVSEGPNGRKMQY